MTEKSHLEYFLVSEVHRKEVQEYLISSFYTHEPLTLGLHTASTDMQQFVADGMDSYISSEASFGARDKSSGALAGVVLNVVLTPGGDLFTDMDNGNEKTRVFREVLIRLMKSVDVFEECEGEKVMEIVILSVHEDYRGRGIAKRLVQMTEEKALALDCQGVTSQLTNIVSQHIFSKMGYGTSYSLDIESLREDDRPLFDLSAMGGTTKALVVTKKFSAKNGV